MRRDESKVPNRAGFPRGCQTPLSWLASRAVSAHTWCRVTYWGWNRLGVCTLLTEGWHPGVPGVPCLVRNVWVCQVGFLESRGFPEPDFCRLAELFKVEATGAFSTVSAFTTQCCTRTPLPLKLRRLWLPGTPGIQL